MTRILAALADDELVVLFDEASDLLEQIVLEGHGAALAQINIGAVDESIVEQLNKLALQYANERAAELVGKKWVGGHLVENANPAWSISKTTRDILRGEIASAYEQGLSNDAIADLLEQSHAFSEARAETIARTETAFADIGGNLQAYKASGQVAQKEWLTAEGCCDECQDLDHVVVGIDEDFPNDGGNGPPLHPNCRCDLLPVLIDLGSD